MTQSHVSTRMSILQLMLFLPLVVLCQKQKFVSLVLDSKWTDTPLHLEASEFLAEESQDLFWKFVEDCITLGPGFIQGQLAKHQYETVLTISQKYLSPAKISLLKFSLALRAHSPVVEMFHQIFYDQQFPDKCETVVEVGGQFTCDPEQLETILNSDLRRTTGVYKVDHVYPTSGKPLITAVLYGEIGTPTFITMHEVLKERAEQHFIKYILRHYVWKRSERKVRLSGYGVELAVKSTEYKAQDDTKVKDEKTPEQEEVDKLDELEGFVFSKLKELHPNKKKELEELKSHIIENAKEIPTLKVWELQELSLQAAQRIIDSPVEEALHVMKDISQNFPVQARSLVHVAVNASLKREIEKNQQMFIHHQNIGPTDTALFLNGMFFDIDATDVFTMLQILKQETKVMEGLHKINIPEEKLLQLLKMDFAQDKQDYAVDIRDTAVQYINNLESDRPYRSWPGSVQDLLRPTYPGMLRSIKRNIYHLIVVADPSKNDAKDIFKLAESFHVHKAPVRIGIVFAVNPDTSVTGYEDAGVALLEAFNFISQDKTPYDGLSFITDVYASIEEKNVPLKSVMSQFKTRYPNEDLDVIFGLDSDYDTGRKLAWDFINRTGIGIPPQVLLNGIVLKQMQLTADMFEEAIVSEIMKQTPFLQKSVYKGELTDSDNVLDFLMKQDNVMPRLNQRILTADYDYIDLSESNSQKDLSDVDHLAEEELVPFFSAHTKYLLKRDEEAVRPLTLWVVVDVGTTVGRNLIGAAFAHMKTSNYVRLGIIHNPIETGENISIIIKLIQTALDTLDRHSAKLFITKVIKENNAVQLISGAKTFVDFALSNMDVDAFAQALENSHDAMLFVHASLCRKILKLQPGDRAVIANGRIIGPFGESEEFTDDDFHLLEKYSLGQFGEKLLAELKDEGENPEEDSEMIMKATSVLLSRKQTRVRHDLKFSGDKYSVVKIPAVHESAPAHEITVIVDPVSKGAQKLAPLLVVLQKVINAHFKIFLNCVDKHSAMPLKSFYRFVIEPDMHFTENGELGVGPLAKFSGLPQSPLFTLAMVTPENWLVEAVRSPYDLDNIHLEQVERGVHADFELEHLLIEGHCFEQSSGNSPRGLQFTLGTNSTPVSVDTIVMANLGYFQLKANPGVWLLRLRQGRSSEIYDISGHENTDTPAGSSEAVVVISSFRSHIIKVRVAKKPDKQYEELLYDESEDQNGIWNTITSMPVIGGIASEWITIWNEVRSTFSGEKKDVKETDDKINIFSLASGHLYERLLRIMMLSVLKHTETPVKFWFLKNYLSPTFKDFLPYMAKKYGFEYELVQYKWPRWLNQQSEKQRIIWGYKILFLDVLFPLDVKKIIFVDADQIVRADMRELRDLDLGGAPYGYTPFCDSRKEMDGYRFWRSGYWASHLAGRKYHISALYVVDLMKFRRIAAGDRLRGQYQGLSQDPNSLANLDQDLPNNMIHQVNIKSLPQEWLWCETWCDDDSKQYAKTIDLCNNPKTKEPKLVSANRLIPEWKDYDNEVKQLYEDYEHHKTGVATDERKDIHAGVHEEL